MQLICTLHASMSIIIYQPEYGCDNTRGDIRAFFSASMAYSYSMLSRANLFGRDFFNRWFSGDAFCAKWVRNRQKSLHKPRKNPSLVRVVGRVITWLASVVCEASSKRLGRTNWPR